MSDLSDFKRLEHAPLKKRAQTSQKYLRELSAAVSKHLDALDAEMRKPESHERGERIAELCNALDYANDQARYFALGVDYRTDKKEPHRAA